MKSDYQPPKETQTALIKLWELIRNTAEYTKDSNANNQGIIDKFTSLENALASRDKVIADFKLMLAQNEQSDLELSQENGKLKDELNQLNQKISEFDAIYKERNSLLAGNEELSNSLNIVREKANFVPVLSDEISSLKADNEAIKAELLQSQQRADELAKLATDFTFAQKDISRKNIELNEKINSIQQLKNDFAEAQSKIFAFRKQEQDFLKAKEQIITLQENIVRLEENLELNESLHEHFKNESQDEKAIIQKESKDLADVVSSLEENNSELMGQILKLQSERNSIDNNYSNLQKQLAELTEQNESQALTLSETTNQVISLNSELERLSASLENYDDLKLQFQDQNEYVILLEEEINTLKSVKSSLEEQFEDLKSTYSYTKISCEKLEQISTQQAEVVMEQNQQLSSNSNAIAHKDSLIEELKGKIELIQAKLNHFQTENIELSEEVENYAILKNKFEILDENFENLKKENDLLIEQKRLLNNDISSNSTILKEISEEKNHFKNELVQINIEKEISSSKIQELTIQLQESISQIDALNKEIIYLKDYLDKLNVANTGAGVENEDLLNELEKQLKIVEENQTSFEALNTEKAELLAELEKQLKIVEENQTSFEALNNEKNELVAELDKQLKIIEENQASFEALNNEKAELIAELDKQLKIIEENQTSFEALNNEKNELVAELEKQLKIVEENQTSFEALNNEKNELVAELEKQMKIVEENQSSFEALNAEKAELQKKAIANDVIFEVSSQDRIDELRLALLNLENLESEKEKEIDVLQQKIDNLKNQLNNTHSLDLFAEYDRDNQKKLINKLNKLEQDLEERNSKIYDLQILIESQINAEQATSQDKIIMDLNTEIAMKEIQYTNLQNKFDTLDQLLRTRYEQINALEKELNRQSETQRVKQAENLKIIEKVEKLIVRVESLA